MKCLLLLLKAPMLLYTVQQKSLKLFYLLKVVRKTVADNDKIGIYGHNIQRGSKEGCYLEKAKETKGKALYKQFKQVSVRLSW